MCMSEPVVMFFVRTWGLVDKILRVEYTSIGRPVVHCNIDATTAELCTQVLSYKTSNNTDKQHIPAATATPK